MKFTINDELEKSLKDLSRKTGHTHENLISKALALLKVSIENNIKENYLVFVNKDRKIIEEVVGLYQNEKKLPKDINKLST